MDATLVKVNTESIYSTMQDDVSMQKSCAIYYMQDDKRNGSPSST